MPVQLKKSAAQVGRTALIAAAQRTKVPLGQTAPVQKVGSSNLGGGSPAGPDFKNKKVSAIYKPHFPFTRHTY